MLRPLEDGRIMYYKNKTAQSSRLRTHSQISMIIYEVFIKLLLAHIIGDFFLQSDDFCKRKLKNGVKSPELYLHSLIIFTLSWIALCSWNAWGIAIIVGASHLIIDTIKCLIKKDNLYSFAVDQLLHCMVISAIAFMCSIKWTSYITLHESFSVNQIIVITIAFLLCSKPANILTKYILKLYNINNPSENDSSIKFHSGALIGTLERWLIVVFVLLGHFEAIGFLLAAKSLIRFKDTETIKTEYVLLGTLISVTIAVACSLIIRIYM